MILLALLYLSFGFTFALPTPSDNPTDIPLAVFTRSVNTFGTRSIWGIIWSCLSTLFACTWIAVHPNMPGPKDSRWTVLRRRVAIMGYFLIAPEMVIGWATHQHLVAKGLAKKYEGRGWTMAHGFFIIMGGFTLHDEQGTALRILESKELEKLSKAGKIAWPSITEEEIQDRSKGDYLSKTIVLMQTSWFIIQCMVRGVYGLAVTELEVATLAFAALTGVTYYLWWDKPLDVRCSVPVYLLQLPNQVHVDSQSPISEEIQIQQQPLVVSPGPIPNPSESNSTAGPNFTGMQQFYASIQRQQQKHGTFLGIAYAFLLHPLLTFFRALRSGFPNFPISNTLHKSSPLRVPTFYTPFHYSLFPFVIGINVALIFGSIHCIAWWFHFPSLQEQLVWRISAASVTGLPIIISFLVVLCFVLERRGRDTKLEGCVTVIATIILGVIYVVARITLLVLPCITLRTLPAAVFIEIQWDAFFPHIG